MNRRVVLFLGSLLITVTVSFLLITGSKILNASTMGDARIPAGTWITWLGMISLPVAILSGNKGLYTPGSKTNRFFSLALKVLISLAIMWVPICYLLSGNLSFTFSEKSEFQGGQTAMRIFWYFSYMLVGLPLLLLILYKVRSILVRSL